MAVVKRLLRAASKSQADQVNRADPINSADIGYNIGDKEYDTVHHKEYSVGKE